MIQFVKDVIFRKFVADIAALLIISLVWLVAPRFLLAVFDENAVWVALVWEWASAQLPTEVWVILEGLEKIHEGVLAGIQFGTQFMAEPTGPRLETLARGIMGLEAWVLKIQLSWFIRLCWFVRRRFKHRRTRKNILQEQTLVPSPT